MNARRLLAILALLGVLSTAACHHAEEHDGVEWLDAKPAPEIAGTGVMRGAPFRLADERGKVAVVSFGYTSCLEVCPDTFAKMKRVFQDLGSDVGEVAFDYVTVDPERDTPEHFRSFLKTVDARFEGIYIPETELPATLERWDVVRRKRLPDPARYAARDVDASAFYAMDHTAGFWIVDRRGRLRARYPHDAPSQAVLGAVRFLLGERGQS